MDYVICYFDNSGTCFIYTGDSVALGMTNPTFAQYTTTLSSIYRFNSYNAALDKAMLIEGVQSAFPLQVCRL